MRRFSLFIVTVTFLLGAMLIGSAAAQEMHSAAKQAIVIDYDTGMVLFAKDAHERMPTSSMSKVITAYAVFQALAEDRLRMETELLVSEKAWRKGGSKMFVEVGDRVSVEDLLRGVIIQSGNDATIVLAEGLAGSEEDFATVLNQTAARLGMENSQFRNASGWPDPEHYSTAYDLALLGMAIIRDFPAQYHYYSQQEFTYNNIKQRNRNPLLYRNIGADGIKTGHTQAGGYGLMASGTKDGRRVVLVINGLDDERARAQEGARLLEWGLRGFENHTLFTEGEIVEHASVVMGRENQLPLVTSAPVKVTIPSAVRNDLKVEIRYKSPLVAPIRAGDHVGTLVVEVPRVDTLEIPLLAADNIEPLGFFAAAFAKARLMMGGSNAPRQAATR